MLSKGVIDRKYQILSVNTPSIVLDRGVLKLHVLDRRENQILLYGNLVVEASSEEGIYLVGQSGVGKSATINHLLDLALGRFSFGFDDKAYFDYQRELVVEDMKGLLEPPVKITRMIHLMHDKRKLWSNLGLMRSLRFVQDELGIQPITLTRIEGDIPGTARRLVELLNS